VLIEAMTTKATPRPLVAHRATVRRLGDVYEQLNASFGSFALDTLKASTAALASTNETRCGLIESSIAALTTRRDALAHQIRNGLNAAAFDGQAVNEVQALGWIAQAQVAKALVAAS
jgi:predicted transcriptional regulator